VTWWHPLSLLLAAGGELLSRWRSLRGGGQHCHAMMPCQLLLA
jgi:hypothetical protein